MHRLIPLRLLPSSIRLLPFLALLLLLLLLLLGATLLRFPRAVPLWLLRAGARLPAVRSRVGGGTRRNAHRRQRQLVRVKAGPHGWAAMTVLPWMSVCAHVGESVRVVRTPLVPRQLALVWRRLVHRVVALHVARVCLRRLSG